MTVYGGPAPAPASATTGRRGGPRVLFALVALLLIATVVIVEVYTAAGFSPDGTNQSEPDSSRVPKSVQNGGPIIGPGGSGRLPAMTVALTFDDGPDPTWTPRVLDVLARYHVPATFFVIGSAVARHPELARRIVREGHEIGLHTFTHPDLSKLPTWRRDLENSQAQLAVADATGRETALIRPPYSSTADALTDKDYATVRAMTAQGYVTVLDDRDSADWTRPAR